MPWENKKIIADILSRPSVNNYLQSMKAYTEPIIPPQKFRAIVDSTESKFKMTLACSLNV